MKFTQAPKKMLLTGLSAAMVVAFAPNLALAGVTTGAPTSGSVPANANNQTVATVQYTSGSTVTSVPFQSDDTATDDDALQAALTFAASSDVQKYKDVTVKVGKDVTVKQATGSQDKTSGNDYVKNADTNGLTVGGDVKIDLGGHTIQNAVPAQNFANNEDPDWAYETPVLTLNDVARGTTVWGSEEEFTKTVYAKGSTAPSNLTPADGFYDSATQMKYSFPTRAAFAEDENDNVQVAPAGTTPYVFNDALATGSKFKAWNKDNAPEGKSVETDGWYLYTIKYKLESGEGTSKVARAGKVEVTNGTVESENTKPAITGSAQKLTLDAATVRSGAANVTVAAALSGYVDSNRDGNRDAGEDGDLTAIEGQKVEFAQTDAEKSAKADKSQSVATVTADIANGERGAFAIGISAEEIEAPVAGTVKANAVGDATSGNNTVENEDVKDRGIIYTETTPAATNSAALRASSLVTLNYGDYEGGWAVQYRDADGYVPLSKRATKGEGDAAVQQHGKIYAGTYEGYVDGDIALYGGAYKYDPSKNLPRDDNPYLQHANNIISYGSWNEGKHTAADLDDSKKTDKIGPNETEPVNRAVTGEGSRWYVYRVGQSSADYAKIPGTSSFASDYMTMSAPVPTSLNSYLTSGYLQPTTASTVKAQDEVGKALVDGNETPMLNLSVEGGYLTPFATEAQRKGHEDGFAALQAQAKSSNTTAQGFYWTTAQTQYGNVKDAKGNPTTVKINRGGTDRIFYTPKKVADVADFGKSPINVTAELVQTNADAKVFQLSKGSAAQLQAGFSAAVGATLAGEATWSVAKPGEFGITVLTTKDTIMAPVAKTIAAIAEIPALKADGSNLAEVEDAIAAARANYAGLTKEQKGLVSNYADLVKAENAVKAYKADKGSSKNAKRIADASSAKVSNVKAKAGKRKATISWSKKKGYKYQVRVRVYNNTTTKSVKYVKTSKTKKTVTKLKGGKRYRFAVRPYKKISGKTYYGKWSVGVSAKIKK